MKLSTLYKSQISLTEWFESISSSDTADFRAEDNTKRTRLAMLFDIADIPYDKPEKFSASELKEQTDRVNELIATRGEKRCALRLIPIDHALPKIRNRGLTIREAITEWFIEQDIDVTKYTAEVVPHSELPTYASIFVVHKNGIYGEIVLGGHHQLTQGFFDNTPHQFSFDFITWTFNDHTDKALQTYIQQLVEYVHIPKQAKQQAIQEKLEGKFVHNYLIGYFETTDAEDQEIMFIDYNRLLPNLLPPPTINVVNNSQESLSGTCASSGIATGVARVILDPEDTPLFKQGDILITKQTTPNFITLMQKAGAVITEAPGILTHAAIICRELGIPCIVGLPEATTVISEGVNININATVGTVTILK